MKLRIKGGGGGEDPPKLTAQQRQEWNTYVDWLDKKGYKGSPLLDKKETKLSTNLFNEFKKENPKASLTLEHIPAIQLEMQKMAQTAKDFEARRGNQNTQSIMSGTSKVDGWPGSKTTSFKFPTIQEVGYNNGSMVYNKDLGFADENIRPVDPAAKAKNIMLRDMQMTPEGRKLEKFADGYLYYQNRDGDWVRYIK